MSDRTEATAGWRRMRLWPLACGAALLAVGVWLLLTTWDGIRGSHPAYLVTLVALTGIGAVLVVWSRRAPTRASRRSGIATWILRAALVVGTALALGIVVYVRPLPADDVAVDALAEGGGVTIDVSATRITLRPTAAPSCAGLVFYPGAKVDPRAYARILRPIVEEGHPVIVLKPPYNIAFLDASGPDEWVGDPADDVEAWVVGGHSLGGTVAARYAETDRPELEGLLLWASYPARSLADRKGLDVLSVSGSEDGLATPEDIADSRDDLPPDTRFVEVEGAVHAFFGDYGEQSGDGDPTVPREDAQAEIRGVTLAQLERVERTCDEP